MDIDKINLHMTQLYLEMARSVFTGIHHPEIRAEEEFNAITGTIFSITTVTIIYSYLALEAFSNYHLYTIWGHSKKAHKAIEELKQRDPEHTQKIIPTYDQFYQNYGRYDRFEDLKTTDLRELGKRMKVICDAFKIPRIHEVDPRLWQEFKGLLEKARQFLVHPFPDPTKFQNMMKTILWERKIGEYAQTAQNMIKYFYNQLGQEVPNWVEKNTLFLSKGFECQWMNSLR